MARSNAPPSNRPGRSRQRRACVNGITTAVTNAPADQSNLEVDQTLALDRGENDIEVVAYNASNLLASLPAQTTIVYTGVTDAAMPKLRVLAIGINLTNKRACC